MVNKTELLAIEWLQKQGYKKEQIIKSQSPDFTCTDGKRYEVKLAYGNKLLFWNTQVPKLKENDTILVFNKNTFITKFLWKDRYNSSFDFKILEVEQKPKIMVEEDTKMILDKCKIYDRETYDDILRRLLPKKIKWD